MKRPILRGATVLALAAMALPTHAQVRAAAATANLSYVLTDLAPADGIAAQAVFGQSQASLWSVITLVAGGQARYLSRHEDTTAPWTLGHDLPYLHAGTGFLGTGSTAAATIGTPNVQTAAASESTDVRQSFKLAPHTGITFTMDAGVDLFVDAASPLQLDATGSTTLVVGAAGASPPGSLIYDTVSNWTGEPPTDQRTVTMVESWRNDSDGWADGELSYRSFVFGWAIAPGSVPAVPEPGAWAMLAAGCGLLGWRARRARP